MKYIETSVKTKENILNALHLLVDNIYDQKDSNPNIKNCDEEEEQLLIDKPRVTYCTNCCIF